MRTSGKSFSSPRSLVLEDGLGLGAGFLPPAPGSAFGSEPDCAFAFGFVAFLECPGFVVGGGFEDEDGLVEAAPGVV
jgi:hypothetical protein